jgi:hypothetical protein
MALVKCRKCRTEVSTEARACPKCGSWLFRTTREIYLWAAFFWLLLLPGILQTHGLERGALILACFTGCPEAFLAPCGYKFPAYGSLRWSLKSENARPPFTVQTIGFVECLVFALLIATTLAMCDAGRGLR